MVSGFLFCQHRYLHGHLIRTDPRPAVRAAEGPNSFHWKTWSWKVYPAAQNFTNRMLFRNTHIFKTIYLLWNATIWYTDHQYLVQYSEIINNLQEIPLIFCNHAVRSCGTWRKGPGQSRCNVLSISDLELYVTETSTGVCDPVTDQNVVRMRKPL